MNRALFYLVASALVVLGAGCQDAASGSAPAAGSATDAVADAARENKLIYGTDDRMDFFEVEPGIMKEIGENSVAAKISLNRIGGLDEGDELVSIRPQNLRQTQKLCPEERYVEQPAAASCSGTLIADDLIMTAGHCMTRQSDCDDFAWVFGFYFEDEDTLADIRPSDVFRCEEIIDASVFLDTNVSIDHAVVRLSRPATPEFTPVEVRTERTALDSGTPVTVIGFGLGLPMKFDSGGTIAGVRPDTLDFFRSNSDAFVGNSGSGVFANDGTLVGILVAGRDDFAFDAEADCNRLATLPDTDAFEENSYGFRAIDSLCNSTARNDYALCSDRCGNELCEFGESAETCPADCFDEADKCGNAACENDETSWNCPIDCDFTIPAQWTCDENEYAGGDGCHCSCGILDPDCDQLAEMPLNCEDTPLADSCTINGVCAVEEEMCGNNSCDRTENSFTCPIDCSNSVNAAGSDDGCSTTSDRAPIQALLIIGLMVFFTRSRRRR